MSSQQLLDKTRKINKILQNSGVNPVSFPDLSQILNEVMGSNVYVISARGKVLGASFTHEGDSSIIIDDSGVQKFPNDHVEAINKINETVSNLTREKLLDVLKGEISSYNKLVTIVPIIGNAQRLGTLILSRYEKEFDDGDLVLAEYAATVVGLEILRSKSEEMEEELRKVAVVQMAIGTLSYSELEAVDHIFKELDGNEGLLVASKIADRAGITRSVIVNALRKFESAGVIDSRSLGMKGTHIRILNDKLMEELDKITKR